MWWVLLVILNGGIAVIPGLLARQRGYSFIRYWCSSFFISFIFAVFLILVLCKDIKIEAISGQYITLDSLKGNAQPSTPQKSMESLSPSTYCGDCGKPTFQDKMFCVYCGSSLQYE